MRSKLAEQLKQEQRDKVDRMTPAERLALGARIAEDALKMYMAAHHLDRRAALRAIRQSRRSGRKYSGCFDEGR